MWLVTTWVSSGADFPIPMVFKTVVSLQAKRLVDSSKPTATEAKFFIDQTARKSAENAR